MMEQAWQKFLDFRYRCQNGQVSIPGTQFTPLITINFRNHFSYKKTFSSANILHNLGFLFSYLSYILD
jgi:hypothetical protein